MFVFLSHFNLLLILSPIPKSHLKLLLAAAATLKVTCRKWKLVLFFLPLSSSSLQSHTFSQVLSFKLPDCMFKKRKKRKKPNLQSHSMLTRIMELFFFQTFIYNTLSYLYLSLLSHPNIYVTGRLCDTLEKIKALEKDRNGFEPGSAIYYPM